jgi:hypothetical protein
MELQMSLPHTPLRPNPNGTHYERLSPRVFRLDRTLGPHHHYRRGQMRLLWIALGVALVILCWLVPPAIVWIVWRHW